MPALFHEDTMRADGQPDINGAVPTEANPEILLRVEAPLPHQRIVAALPITVRGWVLTHHGLHHLSVARGSQVKNAEHGLYRADLERAFPKYPRMFHAGFQCVLDPIFDSYGETRLTIRAEGLNGRIHQVEVPVFLDDEPAFAAELGSAEGERQIEPEPLRLKVEQAVVNQAGLLRVSGWAIGLARVEAIEVFVDGKPAGRAEYGLARADVAAAWRSYPQALTSGFLFLVDAQSFANVFSVIVKARSSSGAQQEITREVRQTACHDRCKPTGMHRLECETAALFTDGRFSLSGWALAGAGIHKINVLRDDQLLGEAIFGLDRPEVGNQFPTLPQSHRSGFSYIGRVDPPAPASEHVFELEIWSKDATSRRFQILAVAQEAQSSVSAGGLVPMFVLDEPRVTGGKVAEPLHGGLTIAGWAISRDGIARIEVEFDGMKAGTAYHGLRREDVASAYPQWPNALSSGFTFALPGRFISAGVHTIIVRAVSKNGGEDATTFTVEGAMGQEEEGPWTLRHKLPAAEQLLIEAMLAHLKLRPRFMIWLRCRDASADQLRKTLRALEKQLYGDWHAVLSGISARSSLAKMLDSEFAAVRSRIRLASGFKAKAGDEMEWVIVADAGDDLAIDALTELAFAIDLNEGADFIYGDERRLSRASGQVETFFKPDWSPHLLMSANYIGRPWAVPQKQLKATGLKLADLDAAGDYSLVLKCTETAKRIVHVPRVLYARDGDGFDAERDMDALNQMIKRRGLNAAAEPGRTEGSYRLRSKAKAEGLVSIIIPTCAARDLIKTCIESLKTVSSYKNIEIIVVDNIRDHKSPWKDWLRAQADAVVEILEPFNWSRFNNLAAQEAEGSFLLFLNDDIEVIQPDWLAVLLAEAAKPEVGVVGPQLLYPGGKVQHAGMFLFAPGKARHAFRFCDASDPGYFGLALTQRDVIGVTGACMLMRREVFDAVGGFDEAHSVINNDLDFCLKTHAQGLSNIYTPFAQLIHHELASRAAIKEDYDEAAFKTRWSAIFHSGDPFFHRHLSRAHDAYRYDSEPQRYGFSGHPYYLKTGAERILAVKVDHIGDFLTAFPAFRRIKEHFPKSRLTVLAAPAAQQLAGLEPAIDEVIPFEFFHMRSGLGRKELDEAELEQLKSTLAPMAFDIAIDLRKHPDTRKLLRYTGAKVIAGFEGNHAFPWLDIARPFEGNERLAAKHAHIADEFVNLVDQIAAAGETDRIIVHKDKSFAAKKKSVIAKFGKEGLYTRPVVCIHPASGTEMRQWPPAYFASLIDQLIEAEDVNIAVIGSPDEAEITGLMMADVIHSGRVTSLIGRLKLAELPYFLASCALFVGNNSGPQHLAAGVGTATIGVHSGVADPGEWGPLGERALAVKCDMTCAPCYLVKREDCNRGLACLTQLSPGMVFAACQRLLRFAQAT